jgi:hypothetical protein
MIWSQKMDDGFDSFKKSFEQAMRELSSKENMRRLGEIAADMIRTRTRLGYGVKRPGASREKLEKLAEATKESKRRKRKRGDLSDQTTPTRSNLTDTGQLLDSLQVTDVKEGEVTIGPKGRRSDGMTNEEVGSFVTENGRPFNNLSDVEEKRIAEEFRKQVQKSLEKLTKT